MKTKLYIIGAGSFGGHVAWNFDSYSNDFEIAGFFDDDTDKIGTEQFGYEVLGPVRDALGLKNTAIFIGIASPKTKKKIIERLSDNRSLRYPSFVHPKAWISSDVEIGQGSIIYPGTSINFGCKVGDFVLMNMNCALGHHTIIGHYSSLAPGVNTGGHTSIGEVVDVGIGVSTLQNVTLGTDSIIGGQSMVINDIPGGVTVVGVPAKIIGNRKENGEIFVHPGPRTHNG